MREKLRWVSPLLVLAALAVTACCLLEYESEYLWKVQELNLFLETPLFFKQQMVTSGWLLMWLGSYFTDFLYVPWQGVLILILWWALLMLIVGKTFRVPLEGAVVLLIPVAAILMTDVTLGYWLYYLKLKGFFFAATIGTTMAVACVWLFRLLPSRFFLREVFITSSTAVLYPLIGFYGLMATGLMGVLVWRMNDMKLPRRLSSSIVAVLSIIAWPLFFYHFVFYQTNIVNIYWTGLPLFVLDKEYAANYIPYYILVASLAALAGTYRCWNVTTVKRPLLLLTCQLLVVGIVAYGVQHYWYKDANFHQELRMQQCIENQDWEGVLAEASIQKEEPTRAIVMMRNLALFRLGRQGNEMYRFVNGSRPFASPLPVNLSQVAGLPLYFHYGQHNICYRWCMEYCVEIGWCAEYLKYLVRCSLVSGEFQLARKYLETLKKTRNHRLWASRYERFLNNKKALKADSEFEPVFHLATGKDIMGGGDMTAEKTLMTLFINVNSTDSLFHEQAVYSALWMKNIQLFWPRFFQYAQSHEGQPMPVHFQEAACLYGHLEKQVDISQMPFDEAILQRYAAFQREANQYARMGEEQMARMLYPHYGDTFYYEYYFVRNLKTY